MSTTPSFFEKNHHLLRRLHSLSGLVPIGVFLIAHLLTNSSVVWGSFAERGHAHAEGPGGAAYFHKEVTWINEEVPHLFLIEVSLWLAIAFHSILGFFYAKSGSNNTARYNYGGNKRYLLQRLSGYVGILFIFYHVATLRWGWTWLVPGGTLWSYEYSASTLALALRGGEGWTGLGLLVSAFYFVGVSLLVFHFANGLWTAAITWGLTVSQKAQERWGYVCGGMGAALMLMAWGAVIGFATLSPSAAKKVEDASRPRLTEAAGGESKGVRATN